jgi:alpha-galactosidase/6-phospho-beta-glucosidase family protein
MNSSGYLKIAYIGGGSRFVPSIMHGIAHDMQKEGTFDLCVYLFDIRKERAERMARYAGLLSTPSMPIEVEVADSRDEALENADLVFASVGLWESHRKVAQVLEAANAQLPDPGPGTAAEAAAVAPFLFDMAQAKKKNCP